MKYRFKEIWINVSLPTDEVNSLIDVLAGEEISQERRDYLLGCLETVVSQYREAITLEINTPLATEREKNIEFNFKKEGINF